MTVRDASVPATKFLFLPTIIVFALVTLGLVGATEWVALQLGFWPRLESSWLFVAGIALCYAWLLLQWWYAYEAYQPKSSRPEGRIAAGGSLTAALAAMIGSIRRARQSRLARPTVRRVGRVRARLPARDFAGRPRSSSMTSRDRTGAPCGAKLVALMRRIRVSGRVWIL